MSVYRTIQRVQPNDVFATPVASQRGDEAAGSTFANGTPTVASPPTSPHLAIQRKAAQPRNELMPFTRRWAELLPEDLRPKALLRELPRIANMIALLWTEPTKAPLESYFDSLLVDYRGGRKGFSPSVARDIIALRDHYDHRQQVTNSVHRC